MNSKFEYITNISNHCLTWHWVPEVVRLWYQLPFWDFCWRAIQMCRSNLLKILYNSYIKDSARPVSVWWLASIILFDTDSNEHIIPEGLQLMRLNWADTSMMVYHHNLIYLVISNTYYLVLFTPVCRYLMYKEENTST